MISTDRSERCTGTVRSRNGPPCGSSSVSKVRSPRVAFNRAWGESGRVVTGGGPQRKGGRPSGSSNWEESPAEIADVDVDHVALGVEVEPPDMLGQHGPGEHAAGVAQEVLEQRVLAGRQLDPSAATPDFASARVESEVGQPEHGRGSAAAPA